MSGTNYYPPFMGHPIEELSPGVHGFTRLDPDGALVIPMIMADTPGAGDVGRYLDGLPTDRKVIFECVMSRVLAAALLRRGFEPVENATFDPDTNEWVDGLVRAASSKGAPDDA